MKKLLVVGIIILLIGVSIPSTGRLLDDTTPPEISVTWIIWKTTDDLVVDFICNVYDNESGVSRVELYFNDELLSTQIDSGPEFIFGSYPIDEIHPTDVFKFVAYNGVGLSAYTILKGSDYNMHPKSQYYNSRPEGPVISNLLKSSILSFESKTLYVGGSGPDNYSKIQDAIDNTTDGDTVFIFNGTYFEILIINKSINLIGENKESTIIDANKEIDGIYIYSPNVNINNLKIQNAFRAGINLDSNKTDNINISKNIFFSNCHGIHPYFGNRNLTISKNIFIDNNNGFTLVSSSNARIYKNLFVNNSLWAMGFYLSSNCDVYKNNITHGKKYGIFLYGLSHSNYFHHNNFYNNSMNAYFILLSHHNKWYENYWKKPQTIPYPIIGSLGLFIPSWLNFDWSPSKKPNYIGE